MVNGRLHRGLWISGSIVLAMILSVIPLPTTAEWYRPQWLLLVVLYWNLMQPDSLKMGWIWLSGLLVDILSGVTLGEHALALTAVSYWLIKFNARLQYFSFWQRLLAIFGLILLYFVLLFAAQGFMGELPRTGWFWLSFFTTAACWPIVYNVLHYYQRRYRVYD